MRHPVYIYHRSVNTTSWVAPIVSNIEFTNLNWITLTFGLTPVYSTLTKFYKSYFFRKNYAIEHTKYIFHHFFPKFRLFYSASMAVKYKENDASCLKFNSSQGQWLLIGEMSELKGRYFKSQGAINSSSYILGFLIIQTFIKMWAFVFQWRNLRRNMLLRAYSCAENDLPYKWLLLTSLF